MLSHKPDQTSAEYDALFLEGGYQNVYELHYKRSWYYPLFKRVLACLQSHGSKAVLEVGCGTGAFAHMLRKRTALSYQGFDFSPVAVQKAIQRTGVRNCFSVGDARSAESYSTEFDSIVCTEVLEHVPEDLECINNWRKDTFCVCSVPNYDASNHVRHFLSEQEVRDRYGNLIEILEIKRIKKPYLVDSALANKFRAIRWARNNPRLMKKVLGLGNFDDVGGWFLFSGRKL